MKPRGHAAFGGALAAALLLLVAQPVATAAQSGAPPNASGAAPSTPGVPVSIATATRKDVPIWIPALGSVQAFYAVQLRSRVDGTLTDVPVTEGQDVKKGDLLAVIDPRPYQAALDAAQAKKTQDEAQLATATADLVRYTALAKEEIASRQKLETVQALAKQLRAAIVGDEAQIEAAQLNLSYCYITAPFDGRVGLRTVDPGNLVRTAEGTPIMTLAQLRPISVTFAVPQDHLPAIHEAMARGKPRVVARSSDEKAELDQGTLLTVDNAIDPATGTIRSKATFPNPQNRLWPGQFVNIRLLVGTDVNVLTVPSVAVQHGPNGLYVYVVKPDDTVARQPVEMTRDDGQVAVIASGLQEGQRVVTDGQSRLQAGVRVSQTADKTAANPAKPGT
ncbi:MAG: efflux RND transporter periplasmic adaptor subunit [Rhodospirillales bacterium]|nr:efflux RND transporter periplasmic adaptor subunit [Rhodospirillales bacterium]